MKIESIEQAYAVFFTAEPGSVERIEAIIYLLKHEDPDMREKMYQAIMESFPNVKASFYDDQGEPYFDFQAIADAWGIPEEERERAIEMIKEYLPKPGTKLHGRQ